ncbi:MAG: chromosome partitioning protein ParB [Chloroflexota bacterium]|jgi:ParB family chromosome partitioning protein|nr:ParB/RepB/Spo0J family partition protein [Caldilinea sp.]GIK74763.1 MAG: chromosome partitioning protein ParB [Chloroflexota bacterium]
MAAESKKRGLGRGLGALIMDTALTPAAPEVVAQAEAGGVRMVAIDHLLPNPHQPRAHFDPTALEELAASIRTHGIIQPLVVTAAADKPAHFWLVAGERRWRAAHIAGLREVPVIVREATPQQLMEWALVENVQRADLNPLEEATAFQALMTEFGLTQAEVAERVGKSRPAIANSVRLLSLPVEAQQAVIDGQISAGHARALLGLPDQAAIRRALPEVIKRDLSVRQTEALVRRLCAQPSEPSPAQETTSPELQQHLQFLEDRFRSALGTKVSLNRNPDGAGKLIVHFYSDEDLESIYRLIAGEEHG